MPTIKYLYGFYEFFSLIFLHIDFFSPKENMVKEVITSPHPLPLLVTLFFFFLYRETLPKHHEITLFLTRDRHPLSLSTSGQAIFSQNHHH